MKLVIYGAQGYALATYEALRTIYPKREVMCFLVSERGNNAHELGRLPVREIAEFSAGLAPEDKKDIEILIATPDGVMSDIERTLEAHGFVTYRRLDSHRSDDLMKLYHARLGRFMPLEALPVGCTRPELNIYMAKSHKDRALKEPQLLPGYIHPLQVGAANTDMRIDALTDDTGDNISERNVNYSEISGLYWVWKNRLSAANDTDEQTVTERASDNDEKLYYGLAQYRRMFVFTEDDLSRLVGNDVDVVLPWPLLYEPDINAHHERYLKDGDWQAMLTALRRLQPEYADAFGKILGQRYMYNYNVILAKKQVLIDYCEWLFPILMLTEELTVPKGSERADRYIGYMAEILETLYFMHNADRLNIVHKGCRLYC